MFSVVNLYMSEKTLYIKNMVCDRCIRTVRDELTKLGMEIEEVRLGVVTLNDEPTSEQKIKLQMF